MTRWLYRLAIGALNKNVLLAFFHVRLAILMIFDYENSTEYNIIQIKLRYVKWTAIEVAVTDMVTEYVLICIFWGCQSICLGFCSSQTGLDSFSPPCLFSSRPRIWISGSLALLFPPPPRSSPSHSLPLLPLWCVLLLISVCFVFSLRALAVLDVPISLSHQSYFPLFFTGLAHLCVLAFACFSSGCKVLSVS